MKLTTEKHAIICYPPRNLTESAIIVSTQGHYHTTDSSNRYCFTSNYFRRVLHLTKCALRRSSSFRPSKLVAVLPGFRADFFGPLSWIFAIGVNGTDVSEENSEHSSRWLRETGVNVTREALVVGRSFVRNWFNSGSSISFSTASWCVNVGPSWLMIDIVPKTLSTTL